MFKVVNIINADTIEVYPGWKWDEKVGNIVRILGYGTPNQFNSQFIQSKLTKLILNKDIELKNPTNINSAGQIMSYVYLNGIEISSYFPELKVNS